jgi:hypothetical protein
VALLDEVAAVVVVEGVPGAVAVAVDTALRHRAVAVALGDVGLAVAALVELAAAQLAQLEAAPLVEAAVVVAVQLDAVERFALEIEITDLLRVTVAVGVERELPHFERARIAPAAGRNRVLLVVEDFEGKLAFDGRLGSDAQVGESPQVDSTRARFGRELVAPVRAVQELGLALLLGPNLRLELAPARGLTLGSGLGRESRSRRERAERRRRGESGDPRAISAPVR